MASPLASYSGVANTGSEVAPTRRRIAISGAKLGLGGVRTHLVFLCRLLLRLGTEVDVFATGSHWTEDILQDLRRLGARIHLPPAVLSRSARLSLLYACLTWPMKVPQKANSLYCVGAGRSHLFLHRFRRRGTVSINHEIVAPPGAQSLAGMCAQRLDTTVANSQKVAELMRGLWPKKPMRVIPFLTSDRTVPAPAGRKSRTSKPLRVAYLGRLVEQKRPDHLVRRWSALSAHPALADSRLDIHGYDPDGRMLREMRELILTPGLSERVRIHGEYGMADLPRILRDTDIVVLPSLWEGLPLVLVESMLHGVPFVATAAGGTEELGDGNPDVRITSTDWSDFEAGLVEMAERLLSGRIDPLRLHAWAEKRYGYSSVSEKWVRCLHDPYQFFNLHD